MAKQKQSHFCLQPSPATLLLEPPRRVTVFTKCGLAQLSQALAHGILPMQVRCTWNGSTACSWLEEQIAGTWGNLKWKKMWHEKGWNSTMGLRNKYFLCMPACHLSDSSFLLGSQTCKSSLRRGVLLPPSSFSPQGREGC